MKTDLFDFVVDVRKLIGLLKNLYEAGEIDENVYFLIEDQILLNSDILVPENERTSRKETV